MHSVHVGLEIRSLYKRNSPYHLHTIHKSCHSSWGWIGVNLAAMGNAMRNQPSPTGLYPESRISPTYSHEIVYLYITCIGIVGVSFLTILPGFRGLSVCCIAIKLATYIDMIIMHYPVCILIWRLATINYK